MLHGIRQDFNDPGKAAWQQRVRDARQTYISNSATKTFHKAVNFHFFNPNKLIDPYQP
jgi:hypothetical protein